ncbi:MAG: Uma2 family endonuclease [Planctomycetes bacterium]|nr:Uma2 family endonuclease [Planctomycetota bacterium]
MAIVESRPYTPADLLAMPDSSGVELVDGNLVEKPVSVLSSMVEATTLTQLNVYCVATKSAVVLSSTNGIQCFPGEPNKVRKPDISVVKRERMSAKHLSEGFLSIAPDVAVEVVSTHEEVAELNEKVEEYLAAGVALVWVIDPETEIVMIHRKDGTVTKLKKNDTLNGEDILPGFTCKVAELFPDMPRR